MSVLDDLSDAIATAGAAAAPSVVRIGANLRGCGVIVTDGLVATSAHNLRGGETTVTLPGGDQVAGTVVGADIDGDLAVLRIDASGVAPIEWAASEPAPGQPVIALGGGASIEPTVTLGFVSGTGQAFRGPRGRRVTGALEHTAPLPRGSSGGPVVDPTGRLVGINTHRLGDGFYLAVPADEQLRQRIDALAAGHEPRRLRLGVGLASPGTARRLRRQVGLPDRHGLLVRGVLDDGPADRAGLRPGDLLVAAGGRRIDSVDDLHEALDGVGGDGRLVLGVVRGTDDLEVTVQFDGARGVEGSV